MSQHFLNRSQVRASLEQVGGERVAEQVRMDARRVEPGPLGDAPQDQERPGARERPAARVQEHLGAAARVEVRPAAGQVAAQRLGGGAPHRHGPLAVPLADHADDPVLEVDAASEEPDRLGHAQPGAVEQLDERLVAQGAGGGAGRRLDQALRLAGRERLRQRPRAARQRHAGRRVVGAGAEQLQVAEEAAGRRVAAGDRRSGEAVRPELRPVALEVLDRRPRHGPAEEGAERPEVAGVGVDRPRRAARREQREEAVELRVAFHEPGFAVGRASSWPARGAAASSGAPSG